MKLHIRFSVKFFKIACQDRHFVKYPYLASTQASAWHGCAIMKYGTLKFDG